MHYILLQFLYSKQNTGVIILFFLCITLLSSRLYCRYRNYTDSAGTYHTGSRTIPPVGTFTRPRRIFLFVFYYSAVLLKLQVKLFRSIISHKHPLCLTFKNLRLSVTCRLPVFRKFLITDTFESKSLTSHFIDLCDRNKCVRIDAVDHFFCGIQFPVRNDAHNTFLFFMTITVFNIDHRCSKIELG